MAARPEFELSCRTKENEEISILFSHGELTIYPKIDNRIQVRRIRVEDQIPTSRIAVGLRIDPSRGSVEFFFNGSPVAQVGKLAGESRIGVGANVYFYSSSAVLSNVWVGPWSGGAKHAGDKPQINLSNGDSVSGEINRLGHWRESWQSKARPDRWTWHWKGCNPSGFRRGNPRPRRIAAARIRLADGCILNVDGFRYDGHELRARSEWLRVLSGCRAQQR